MAVQRNLDRVPPNCSKYYGVLLLVLIMDRWISVRKEAGERGIGMGITQSAYGVLVPSVLSLLSTRIRASQALTEKDQCLLVSWYPHSVIGSSWLRVVLSLDVLFSEDGVVDFAIGGCILGVLYEYLISIWPRPRVIGGHRPRVLRCDSASQQGRIC